VKQKVKKYANQRAQTDESKITIGDTVLVCQKKNKKFTTKFDLIDQVVDVRGNMLAGEE